MPDEKQPDSCRRYENTKHFEFVNVVFHGVQTFVSGEYVFRGMLDATLHWSMLTVNDRSQIPG